MCLCNRPVRLAEVANARLESVPIFRYFLMPKPTVRIIEIRVYITTHRSSLLRFVIGRLRRRDFPSTALACADRGSPTAAPTRAPTKVLTEI
jgi:hypothetical protein